MTPQSAGPSPTARTRERTRTEPPNSVDVAIVGAGTGGLTAGAFLARHGLSVALFDHHYVAGGCATRFSRGPASERYNFDVGLHYIGECGEDGVITEVLNQLDVKQEFNQLDPDGFDTLVFPDFTFAVPTGIDRYRDRLVAAFPEERAGIDRWMRFMRHAGVAATATRASDTELTPGALWKILSRGPLAAVFKNATLNQVLDKCTRNPRLRAVIAGQHGDYGLPPSEVAALFHAGLMLHFMGGAYYPKGGGQAISDKLAESVEAAGGSIHLRRGVQQILIENGRAVGVRTEERRGVSHDVRAKVVLSNADARSTLVDLIEPGLLSKRYQKQVNGWAMPSGIFMTFLGVEADLGSLGMGPRNYWTVDDYDLDAAYHAGRQAGGMQARGAYITSASLKDPGCVYYAPAGVSTVEVMTLMMGEPEYWFHERGEAVGWDYKKSEAYLAQKDAVEADLVRRLEEQFPGVTERIVFRESATPMSQIRYTRSTSGSGYGIAVTPAQFKGGKARPGPRTPVPGLYLCGASSRHLLGIMGALLSGRDAARRVAEDLGRPLRADGGQGHGVPAAMAASF